MASCQVTNTVYRAKSLLQCKRAATALPGSWSAGLGPSVLGVADHGRGAVGVGAEQGRDGVVAMARVVGCENHLGGRRDSCFKQSHNQSVPWKFSAKLIIFMLFPDFSGGRTIRTKPNMLPS